MHEILFGGLDFGTSGARISIINKKKDLIFSDSVKYKYKFKDPRSWTISCEELLNNLPLEIKSNITKLAISGTSGTLIACNSDGLNLGEAIAYHEISQGYKIPIEKIARGEEHLQTPYSSLAKALKLLDKFGENIILRHQSDWITGWLLQDWTYGEEGNNIKLGWNLMTNSWPKGYADISWKKCLPEIIESGNKIGFVNTNLAKRFNLNRNLLIVAGTTDSNAAFLAAGLNKDEGLTVLGTTIVLKKKINHPIKEKGITIHRVSGEFICGGASNAGCGVLSKFYSDMEIEELSRQINPLNTTSLNLLPLNSKGERFPIDNPYLEPILDPRPVSDSLYLQALFEGLAQIELKGWEKLNSITGSFPKRIVTLGGGAKNPQWRSIRERIIKIPIVSCNKTTSFGTALLALKSV